MASNYIKAIQAETEMINESKIKKKARRWAILVLLLLLVMLFYPWMSHKILEEERFEQVVEIQFDQKFREQAAAERSSAKAAPAAEVNNEETEVAEPEAVEEPVEEVVKPEPVPETKPEPKPEPKTEKVKITPKPSTPVITSSESTRKIEKKVEKMLEEVAEKSKVEKVSSQVTEVTEEITDDFMSDLADYFKKSKKKKSKPGGGKKSDNPDTGTSSTSGEGDSGSSDTGDSDTDGQGDSGDSGDDFDGDGLLSRKVIKRTNLGNIVKESGKITVNICVNRDGKVIFAEADRSKSTIKDRTVLKNAEVALKGYVFEKDYTVAERQCASYSFLVTVDD